ncbi:MAG TPA: hypothetical protein VGR16_07555 [Thermomicrobiales bacterium]|nr:hypothetical protein [Thermomicrobiales bacterium]
MPAGIVFASLEQGAGATLILAGGTATLAPAARHSVAQPAPRFFAEEIAT